MKKLENFLPRLLPWVAGAPEPLAYQALVDSAIQFCEDTHIVRYTTDPIQRIDGVADYDLDMPDMCDLVRVIRVWYGTDPYGLPSGSPTNWIISDLEQVRIYPTPQGQLDTPMFIEVAIKPQRTATAVSDQLYMNWIEAIVGGAIFRICSQPDQIYTNPQNASTGAGAYRMGKNKAMWESTKGRVQRDTVVRPRPFV